MIELKDLYATLKVVGQDALAKALSELKVYIDEQDAAGNSGANTAIAAVQAQLDALIGAQGGDTDKILNTFNEIKAFLADYSEDDTLKSLIDAATTAAQTAASTAESNAKTYADGKVGSEKTRAEGAESALGGRITNLENIDVMTVAEAEKMFENTFFPFVAVDLGLPSGTLWADRNVGAKKANETGLFFSWGNVDGVTAANASQLTEAAYAETSGAALTGDITQGGANDAAAAAIGGDWVMPTKTQFSELINDQYTTRENAVVNGVNGTRFTSKTNGNSIFLPRAGYVYDGSLDGVGSGCYCWSSTRDDNDESVAWHLVLGSNGGYMEVDDRTSGYSVRPVQNASQS